MPQFTSPPPLNLLLDWWAARVSRACRDRYPAGIGRGGGDGYPAGIGWGSSNGNAAGIGWPQTVAIIGGRAACTC